MFGPSAALLTAILLSAGGHAPSRIETSRIDPIRQKALYQAICTACHTVARVEIQSYSHDEWAGLIRGMVSEGAAVSDEEFESIVDYLAKNFGTKE